MHYTISHTRIGNSPFWYHLECAKNLEKAKRRAQGYVLDHGGYACVKDQYGVTVFGCDPDQLRLDILNGTNRLFPRETSRRRGFC